MYDVISPGHVLTVHEESAKNALLALPGDPYSPGDFDIWGGDSLLSRALHALNGHIGGTVGQDLKVLDFYQVGFDEPGSYRPPSLLPLLGRRRFGDFSFIGGTVVGKRHLPVYVIFFVEGGTPKAYIPIPGNALKKGVPVMDRSHGSRDYPYDGAAIAADIRRRFQS